MSPFQPSSPPLLSQASLSPPSSINSYRDSLYILTPISSSSSSSSSSSTSSTSVPPPNLFSIISPSASPTLTSSVPPPPTLNLFSNSNSIPSMFHSPLSRSPPRLLEPNPLKSSSMSYSFPPTFHSVKTSLLPSSNASSSFPFVSFNPETEFLEDTFLNSPLLSTPPISSSSPSTSTSSLLSSSSSSSSSLTSTAFTFTTTTPTSDSACISTPSTMSPPPCSFSPPNVVLNPSATQKPFACSHCGRSFWRKFDCKRHMRTHTFEKPFECDFCERSFARKDALNRHLQANVQCRTKLHAF
ncbi:hypothetical protein HMI54_005156 [Coelomomyces lativittatus]|nr:hypothetical protein HMI56_001729 [Coelomomyces lativittatus]KAJ1506320.1 hypothetical protein HMI54_005156 [Coelomomyces lativittatus]